MGVHKDLQSVWIAQGDDEVEGLEVEVWTDDFPVRVLVAYGPQLSVSSEKPSFGTLLKERRILLIK